MADKTKRPQLRAGLPPARAAELAALRSAPVMPAANDNIAADLRAEWKARLPSSARAIVTDGATVAAVNDNDREAVVDLTAAAYRLAATVARTLPADGPKDISTYWPQAPRGWADYASEPAKSPNLRATPAQISRMDYLYSLLPQVSPRERRLILEIADGKSLRAIAADLGETVHRVRSDHRLALRYLGVLILTGRLPGRTRKAG